MRSILPSLDEVFINEVGKKRLELFLAAQADIYKEVMKLTNPKIWYNGTPFAALKNLDDVSAYNWHAFKNGWINSRRNTCD
jgi:hypothetical protein